MSTDALQRPLTLTSELARPALLLASVLHERSDPFGGWDAQLLWDFGLWPMPLSGRRATTQPGDVPHRFCHVRA